MEKLKFQNPKKVETILKFYIRTRFGGTIRNELCVPSCLDVLCANELQQLQGGTDDEVAAHRRRLQARMEVLPGVRVWGYSSKKDVFLGV